MFNPNEHMMQLKGKDYLQVMWRLVWFREAHPDWCIDTSILEMDADHAVFKAVICDENGVQKCAGHGSESKRDFGDFLEKAETKAIGRALAMMGFGTQFTGSELDEGERIVDSPVNRSTGSKEAAQAAGNKKMEEITKKLEAAQKAPAGPQKGKATEEQRNFIEDNADDETWVKATAAFGEKLERMTAAQAEKLIARIKEAS